MLGVDVLDPLRRRDEADEHDRARPRLLDGRNRGDARVAGREHRVEHDRVALLEIAGQLHVVLDRLQRLLVPVHAQEADPSARDEGENAVQHPQSGAQHRADRNLLARDPLRHHPFERRLDLDRLGRKVLGRFVGQQQRHLVGELAEVDGRRLLVAQVRQLVLHQRVRDDRELAAHATYVVNPRKPG